MTHIKVSRGVEVDFRFNLRKQLNGALTDDDAWTDGLTSAQWPAVTWRNAGGTVVTSSFQKDITGVTISEASHKHPDQTTGIWRKEQGRYRQRIQPSAALAFGNYTIEVAADINGAPFLETHEVELVDSADIEFEDEIMSNVEVADVTRGIKTSMSPEQVLDLIGESAEWFVGEIEAHGDTEKVVDYNSRRAIILQTRADIMRYDISAGLALESLRSGDVTVKYGDRDALIEGFESKATRALKVYMREHLGMGKPYAGRVDKAREEDSPPFTTEG